MSSFQFAGLYTKGITYKSGPAASGVAVTIKPHGSGSLATIYTDRTKATTTSNPVTTDSNGNLSFFADPGEYDFTALGGMFSDQVPADPLEYQDPGVASVAGRTGAVTLAVADIAGAAPLASPALTGNPTAPTQSPGDSTTKLSTTAFVAAAIAALVNGAPGALDTLNELAAALGNDASLATDLTNAIALKLAKASNLADVADTGTSRANIHVPALVAAACVAVANVASLSGNAPIDGYSPAATDIVLLTAQTTSSQNGQWLIPAGGGAWTRPTDFATAAVVHGRSCDVMNGGVYAGTHWILETPTAGVTIDTSAQTWKLSGSGTYATVTFLSAATLASTPAAKIQAAINANAGTGIPVVLGAGTFALEAPIALKSHTILRGAGRGVTILQPQGTNCALRYNDVTDGASTIAPITDLHLSDFTVDGQLQSGTYSYTIKGLWLMYVQETVIERVDTVNTYATGIGLDYPMGAVAIRDCVITTPGRGGGGNGIGTLVANQQTAQMVVSDVTVISAHNNGFLFENPNLASTAFYGVGIVVNGCLAVTCGFAGFCDANTFGTVFEGCTDIGSNEGFLVGNGDSQNYPSAYGGAIIGCASYNAVADGIYFTSPAGTTPTFSHYRVANNVVIGAGNIGIHVFAALYDITGLQITGNHVRGNNTLNTSNYGGIKIEGPSPRVVSETQVTGNLIVGNLNNGIRISCNLTDCVLDNTIINESGGPQTNGIQVGAFTWNRVKLGGSIQGHTTNFATSGTTFTEWTVETPIPGYTRNTGAPTVTAPKGTLYERIDGISGSLIYVNTDGGTTWVAIDRGTQGLTRRSGALAETMSRLSPLTSQAALTTQLSTFQAIELFKGQVVSTITFESGTTPANGPQNQWFGLWSPAKAQLALTADDTTTAWLANAEKTLTLSSPYTVPSDGLYYISCMVKASTAVPTLHGISSNATTNGQTPVLAGQDSTHTALTNPASAPATAAITANGFLIYGYVS